MRDSAARIRRHGVLRFGDTVYAGNPLECAIRRRGAGSVIVAEVASTPPRVAYVAPVANVRNGRRHVESYAAMAIT